MHARRHWMLVSSRIRSLGRLCVPGAEHQPPPPLGPTLGFHACTQLMQGRRARRQVPYACVHGIEGYRPPHAAGRVPQESARGSAGGDGPEQPRWTGADGEGDVTGDGDICLSVF